MRSEAFVRGQILCFSRRTAEALAFLLQAIASVISLSYSQNDACIRIHNMPSTSLAVNQKIIAAVTKNLIHVDVRSSVTFKTGKFTVMAQATAQCVLPGLNISGW